MNEKDFARFAEKVALPSEPNGCMEWLAARSQTGYGLFHLDGALQRAHRVAYDHFVGPIPGDTPVVRHRCDNPSCVRPDHLEIGTQADNVQDMVDRGRGVSPLAANCAARTHCPIGHELTAPNLIPSQLARGYRSCLTCDRARAARHDAEFAREADNRFQDLASTSHLTTTRDSEGRASFVRDGVFDVFQLNKQIADVLRTAPVDEAAPKFDFSAAFASAAQTLADNGDELVSDYLAGRR